MATTSNPLENETATPHLQYWRFNLLHRVTHLLLIVSMVGLIGSRFPLKFSDFVGARGLTALMGGVAGAGLLHRASAIILGIACAMNLVYCAYLVIVKHKPLFGPESIVPRWRDFTDLWQHFQFFLGRAPRPKFDRYTYWEKFDYLAVFWGMAIIGGSGLVIWFPTFFAQFLPGLVINLAYLAHSDEAMLAFGFLIVVHLFNTHLRPERFPMDKVMFTGKISAEEWARDHALEWERMQSQPDQLEEQKVH